MTSNEPTTRDNAAIARRAATELDHTSPLSGSPVFANIALRGILHALLALVDAQQPLAPAPKPATRKPAPTKETSK